MVSNNIVRLIVASAFLLFGGIVQASVVQTIGASSAVTSLDASADFENSAALVDNPYIENGLSFSRTNLTFNNNGCGFAGCATAFPGFGGTNYMYGTGFDGYFEMSTTGANIFHGLEFITGSGVTRPYDAVWTAFLGGNQVGTGSVSNLADATILGFASLGGFDTLRYAETRASGSTFVGPAFDAVRAMYISAVPVPAAVWLFGTALIGLVGFGKHKPKIAAGVHGVSLD